jgi:hypothetical protein
MVSHSSRSLNPQSYTLNPEPYTLVRLSAARAELEGQVSSLKASYAEVEESMSILRAK